ncbi:hypothetical protein GCM10023208_10820 [Erythrobacter westpacificensis]|uniref:Transposase n=1 Tax=Erythrobacter westpacificensis TaxID=1055231 RepID=A0ABP9K6X3_9SPHN
MPEPPMPQKKYDREDFCSFITVLLDILGRVVKVRSVRACGSSRNGIVAGVTESYGQARR